MRQFPLAFKIEVVKEVKSNLYTQKEVANRHGVSTIEIWFWTKQYDEGRLNNNLAERKMHACIPQRLIKE
jgi:transposase-like protein